MIDYEMNSALYCMLLIGSVVMCRNLQCFASAAFGMEGLVSRELKKLNMQNVKAENGGVCFTATAKDLFICNMYLHTADRLFVILASGICQSFEDLFQLVQTVDWSDFYSGNEAINITCKCTRSKLMSPRDCQSVAKKAIIEKLRKCGVNSFPEKGSPLPVHISVRNNLVRVFLNVSGEALSRRGYRTWNGEAPLRETLAAALVELSPWIPGLPLHDPCCGTGTILIEAAFTAARRAPGIKRHFSMETIKCFRRLDYQGLRSCAASEEDDSRISGISGSDISTEALDLASKHILQAGLKKESVNLFPLPLQELNLRSENGVFICNPPYGERLSDQKHCRVLYRDLRLLKERHPSWKLCAITSDPAFERYYGKRSDQMNRFYNGRLECNFYIYA